MQEYKELIKECAKELEGLMPEISQKLVNIAKINSPDRAFLEYLKVVEQVSLMKTERKQKNKALIILWRYGEALEKELYSDVKFFAKPLHKRIFRFVDWKIIGMLFLVFIILPAITSNLWSFRSEHYVLYLNENVDFPRELCNYRTSWLYDFRTSMVCVLKYGYGSINVTLRGNSWEKGVEAQRFISDMEYDFDRVKSPITYIQTPKETLRYKKGVCSDFALLVANILLDNNVSPVYIVHTVVRKEPSGGHAAAGIYVNGTLWILDWGSKPTKFQEYLENIDRIWEIREVRIYRITRDRITLERIYKARLEDDRWRFLYSVIIMLGIFILKRREWWIM
ncbi:transglutaminase-like domain-containing protein [Pyrococcus horikoshii]|uniref:UPF0252 protein PH1321 n=2 Tax=Pyrococcus horikoshii TaxID=53953 RepID=Y1321_PYRHO|nr:transglutaminase-like domain-containing protein [Pyrococcus horikoshii]O59045.1 RecName: Full=UPF0252 protein PH1321 [Pyrococcus horikoshii OT3]BAA30427.1 337aa long hypothetical protein [Pyrococcus horikoshii OT3]HII60328.1 hypothetical protein [Pyrococcus horikoshii]